MSDLEIFDGESYRGVSRKKLLALVRKLREQRDKSTMAWANCKDYIHDKGAALIAADNDELDRIVRGG